MQYAGNDVADPREGSSVEAKVQLPQAAVGAKPLAKSNSPCVSYIIAAKIQHLQAAVNTEPLTERNGSFIAEFVHTKVQPLQTAVRA